MQFSNNYLTLSVSLLMWFNLLAGKHIMCQNNMLIDEEMYGFKFACLDDHILKMEKPTYTFRRKH